MAGISVLNLAIFLLLPLTCFSQTPIQKTSCDTSLWHHVYHQKRLVLKETCKEVLGTVISKKKEDDGDYHIKLRLDKGQAHLLNEKNLTIQDSCLVIEIICANGIKQKNAVECCQGFLNTIPIPKKGQHIKVTGSFVEDKKHGWNEIHPVSSIEVLP